MKILVAQDMKKIIINNIISIHVEKDNDADEYSRPYMLIAYDVNGDNIYLASYLEEEIANKVLDDIMYWMVDDNRADYHIPLAENLDEELFNEPYKFKFYSDDKELISKISAQSSKGTECIKAQNGTLIFLNNIVFFKDYDLSIDGFSELDLDEQNDLRREFNLDSSIQSIIIADNIRREEILLGQFKGEYAAEEIIDHFDLKRIFIIPQDE